MMCHYIPLEYFTISQVFHGTPNVIHEPFAVMTLMVMELDMNLLRLWVNKLKTYLERNWEAHPLLTI